MKKAFFLILLLCNNVFSYGSMFDFYIPWNDSSPSITDMSSFVARNIDADGFVKTDANGHFVVNSGRIKFWGTNTTFGGNFPSNTNASYVASRLAKYGFNVIRFHHMDMYSIWTTTNPDRVLSASQLQKMDFFINELKKKGVYTDLNLLVSRPFAQGGELHPDINQISDWKVRAVLGFFDPAVKQLQKDFARDLLTHVNPYTGNAYINEPAVAFIEINNENGLVHAFLSGQTDYLPSYYSQEINSQWNGWLKTKYASDSELETAWGVLNQPLGSELLSNGTFSSGVLSPWLYNPQPGVTGSGTVDIGAGPGGINAAKINVVVPGTAGWYVQFNHGGLNVTAGVPYTITFYAKADTARTVSVSLGMNHTPWSNLGFTANINLTSSWQLFAFTFTPSQSDTNARINFGEMGLAANATYWFTDISLKQGGMLGLSQGESLYGTGIENFKFAGGPARTAEARKDWFRFLTKTETDYWLEMYDYIKNTLGAKSLVFGTIIGCSNPNVQAKLDAIDTHAYWEHPIFPGTPWDSVDWYLNNKAMVNYPDSSTVASIGMKSVLNKPLLITETNSPHPGTFSSDHSFITSAYASFQDWDAVFPFDYNGDDNWDKRYIDGYFAVANNPLKMASYPASVISFYRGDIKPANQQIVVPIGAEDEINGLLTAGAWKLVDAEKAGENAKAVYIHKVRIAVEGQSVPSGSIAPGTTNVSGSVLVSDTGELRWDNTYPLNGVFIADTAKTKYLTGFTAERTYYLSGVTITPRAGLQNFSAIALNALDGNSFDSATRILVTALGCQKNNGDSWYIYPNTPVSFPPPHGASITLRNNWGYAQSKVEGVTADIILPCNPLNTRVWALDNSGARSMTVTVNDSAGNASFRIADGYGAVWYEVEVLHPEYTPTVTPSITPFLTPTITPTVTMTSTMITADIIDDFVDMNTQNYWMGYWYSYKDPASTMNAQTESAGGPITSTGAYHASAIIAAGGYGGIGTNLAAAGAERDVSAYEGIQLYIKNSAPVDLALVTGNYSEVPLYNNPQFLIPANNDWTFVQVPFSSMTHPWGSGPGLDLTRGVDIQWKFSAGPCELYVDDVAMYYGSSVKTSTATRTITPSITRTVTATPAAYFTATMTKTVTPTVTKTNTLPSFTATPAITVSFTPSLTETSTALTLINTPTVTATPALNPLNTEAPEITDVFAYPQPYSTDSELHFFVNLKNSATSFKIKIYTSSFRLINEIIVKGAYSEGTNLISIPAKKMQQLSNGTYYYYIVPEAGVSGKRSKAGLLTVIRKK